MTLSGGPCPTRIARHEVVRDLLEGRPGHPAVAIDVVDEALQHE